MNLLLLAVIGVVEALVWLYRIRTATAPSAGHSAMAAFLTTGTRLAFVWAGMSAVLQATPWWAAMGAYVVPATVGTWFAHRHMEARRP